MSFPQEQVAWLLANRERLIRYAFVPQFLVAAVFLTFSYVTGKDHAHLLYKGVRTRGTIIDFKAVRVWDRSSSGVVNSTTTIYEPLVEFSVEGRVFRVQEWKGSRISERPGRSVVVLYDRADPSMAMMDRGFSNWIPWAITFVCGVPVALAALKGLLVFLFMPLRASSAASSA
jgi:uncharacterized protein DUF3592